MTCRSCAHDRDSVQLRPIWGDLPAVPFNRAHLCVRCASWMPEARRADVFRGRFDALSRFGQSRTFGRRADGPGWEAFARITGRVVAARVTQQLTQTA
jgi:hypothetical protein